MRLVVRISWMWILLAASVCAKPAPAARQPIAFAFEVESDGLYVLDRATLLSHGMAIDEIDPRTIGLYCEGQPVPIYIVGQNDGRFDDTDSIMFYGQYPRGKTTTRRIQNDHNHYVLKWGQTDPLRYRASAPPVPENPTKYANLNAYRHAERFEGDTHFERFFHPHGEETDFYFWANLRPYADKKPFSFCFWHSVQKAPPGAKDTFDLKVKFYGVSDSTLVDPNHDVLVAVGDSVVGEAKWNGEKEYLLEVKDLPVSLFGDSPGSATVCLKFPAERVTSGVVDSIQLDWVEITYWHSTDARGARIFEFNTREQPLPVYKLLVSSLDANEGDVFVFDHTRGEIFRPAEIRGPQGEILRVLFPKPEPAEYAMVSRLYVNLPLDVRPLYDDPAFSPDNQADMIIVSHPEFLSEIEELADYRRAQGLSVLVVDLQSVFDRFSYGFFEDKPVREYLRYAWRNYREPRPRYVLLVGDATFDYKNLILKTDRNLFPIHWLSSNRWQSGGYPSDNWYAQLDNDDATPEVAVGRLPVNAPGQIRAIFDKVKACEKAAAEKPDWARRAVALTSIEKRFREMIRSTARRELAGFDTTLLFPSARTVQNDVRKLQEAINQGCSVLYYLGHGGAFVWRVGPADFASQKDLFTPARVRELQNRGRYPLALVSSCYSAAFDNYLSIGESLLMEPDKGAVAVVATGWKSLVETDHPFNVRMMQNLFLKKMDRLGDAFLEAKRANLISAQYEAEVDNSFLLLGDPALKIYHPD